MFYIQMHKILYQEIDQNMSFSEPSIVHKYLIPITHSSFNFQYITEMDMLIVKDTLTVQQLEWYKLSWWSLVKAVVDTNRKKIVIWCELHVDGEQKLLGEWSDQSFLRWINLYPQFFWKTSFIEFDSVINLRPRNNNRSRWVDSPKIRKLIKEIVLSHITQS